MITEFKKDHAGITLAEMLVTFALMGIFLAAVATVISSSVVVHSEITGAMYAQSVSEILLDKVTGELAAAKPMEEQAIVTGEIIKDGQNMGAGVSFYDRDGMKACFTVEDGLLVMESENRWKMDEKAYMGYRITKMQIQRLNDENVFEVIFTIKNLKTGFSYTASRTVKCYNFRTEEDFEKIMEEDILLATPGTNE